MPIHLVRHGEVHNPRHVVYADLPGFHLSDLGRQQARLAATRLATAPLAAIVTSPLERAVATAELLAQPHGIEPQIDDRLTEWQLGHRWAGTVWEDLPEVFPGEFERYVEHPEDLPFSPESLAALAARISGAIEDWSTRRRDGDLVFVSHQDPIQAGKRALTGEGLAGYHADKPSHCSTITLERTRDGWVVIANWRPPIGHGWPPRPGS